VGREEAWLDVAEKGEEEKMGFTLPIIP